MYERLTGDSANEFLKDITTYEWDDDGAAAGALFDWIANDSSAIDTENSSRAAQSATVIADFLLNEHDELMAISSGFLGSSKVTAAQRNPILIRSYATALSPYLGQLVGDDKAFEAVHTAASSNPKAVRDLFSVLVADGDAGRTINDAAAATAEKLEDDAVDAWRAGQSPTAGLRSAGAVVGAVGARTTWGEADNKATVRVAANLVRSDHDPAEVIVKYVQNGQLMDPDSARQAFGSNNMRNYFLDISNYAAQRGFSAALLAFHEAYRSAGGETPK